MQQAYFDKVIDFSKARPLDRNWHTKLRWALQYVEKKNLQQLLLMQHDLHCGAINYTAGQQIFDKHWKQALNLEATTKRLLFPWQHAEDHSDEYRHLSTQWEKQFGRLDDPETQKKIDDAVATLRKRNRQR